MKNFLTRLTTNKRLALLAFVLGLIALVAGNPYRGTSVTVDAKELAWIVEKQVDHISASELADWLIQGKSDFRLIDLRTEKEYAEYHIPEAENVPITALGDYPIGRDEKIVLYSEGGIHSAQAWMLLKAQEYKGVYMLMGGLEAWTDSILFPGIPENPSPEQLAAFAKMARVSTHFGGTPRTGSQTGEIVEKKPMPKLDMPTPVKKGETAKKKKKEGC